MKLFLCALTLISLGAATSRAEFAPKAAKPNAQMQAVLDQLAALNPKPVETLPAAQARQQPSPADAVKALLTKERKAPDRTGLASVKNISIPGAAGAIAARVYTPAGKGPFPVIVYFHGGGWVLATIDTYDSSAYALAKQTDAIVLSVEYRKGPEAKFPAAHDDAFAAYRWVLANAATLSGDASRIAIAGESAGGNLALNVAIEARDMRIQEPNAVLAVYPIAGNDMNTASYVTYANAKPLDKSMMAWFFQQYLADAKQGEDRRINLVRADLHDLPPVTLITDQIDPLNSEGALLAKELKAQRTPVAYKNYLGVTHEFFGMADVLNEAKDAQAFAATNLKKEFAKTSDKYGHKK